MDKGPHHALKTVNWPVFLISGGFLLLFVVMAFTNMEMTSSLVDKGFSFAITYFGVYWQVLLLATFLVGAVLAVSKLGAVRLGKLEKPEMGFFKYVAIVVTTGLGAGGVFWAAAEPMYYFMDVPPTYSGLVETTSDAVRVALA